MPTAPSSSGATGPIPTEADVRAALARFVGEIEQVPPMYSALKRDGVPLYRLARRGVTVEREARRVTIEALTFERYAWPELELSVRCSKGTYVRTLVVDVAAALGTLGHVRELRRCSVDPFTAEQMTSLDALEELAAKDDRDALDRLLLPADSALPDWPAVVLGPDAADRLSHGQAVAADPAWPLGRIKVYRRAAGPLGDRGSDSGRPARAAAGFSSLSAWSGTDRSSRMPAFVE